jgi:hypothetical protein
VGGDLNFQAVRWHDKWHSIDGGHGHAVGGGLEATVDFTFAELSIGYDFMGLKDPNITDNDALKGNFLTITALGKYPLIFNDKFTLSPLFGFAGDIYLGGKMDGEKIKRSDVSDWDYTLDMFVIDFGAEADIALTENLCFRGGLLLGIKANKNDKSSDPGTNVGFAPKLTAGVIYKF